MGDPLHRTHGFLAPFRAKYSVAAERLTSFFLAG
jgi:hypothetical protein